MDPDIFADPDPDPGSQNVADPTDPDPKHCLVLQVYSLNFKYKRWIGGFEWQLTDFIPIMARHT